MSMPGPHSQGSFPDRRPCHGPSCQQSPLQLPPSTPFVSVDPQDRWGWMATIVVQAPEPTSFLAIATELVQFPMIAFRLDRPPKV